VVVSSAAVPLACALCSCDFRALRQSQAKPRKVLATCRPPHPNIAGSSLRPDQFVVALVVAEFLLWLSGRCAVVFLQWTQRLDGPARPRHGRRGLHVLLLWFAAAFMFRRQFEFSLPAVLLLVVAVAIPCGWLVLERDQARSQEAAADWVRNQMHGSVV